MKHLRISIIGGILCLMSVQICAAQVPLRIRGSFQNQSLQSVLDQLRERYPIVFAYDVELASSIRINKELPSLSLEEAMHTLLESTGLGFQIVQQGHVIIRRRPAPASLTVPKPVEQKTLYRIAGRIVDATSEMPLAYASVRVKDAHLGASARVDGSFFLQTPSPDLLTLEVSYVGYEPQQLPLMPGQNTANLHIHLQPLLHELAEVLIEDAHAAVLKSGHALSQFHINPRQLARISGLGTPDIMQSLRLLPGISGANEVSPGLYLRGGTPDQNLVLFDGITAYRADHFLGLFSAFNPDATHSVEVATGGFDARYGNRVSGVVDIRGKAAGMDRVRVRGGLGLLSGQLTAEVPLVKNKVSLLVAGRQSLSGVFPGGLYQRMLTTLLGDQTARTQHYTQGVDLVQFRLAPSFGFSDIHLKLAARPSDKDSVTVSFYHAHDRLSYSIRKDSSQITEDHTTKIVTHTDELTLKNEGMSTRWNRKWSPVLQSGLSLAYSGFTHEYHYALETETSRFSYASQIDQINRIRELSASWDNTWQAAKGYRMDFGARFSRQDVRHRYASGYRLLDQAQESGDLYTGYVQNHLQLRRNLEIKGGLRYNYFDNTRRGYIEPRLSVNYRPVSRLRLSLATGRYYQFLNRVVLNNDLGVGEDFWAMATGATIPVQRSTHAIFGIAYDSDDFLISLESYLKRGDGLLEYLHGIYLTELDETVEGELVTGGSSRARGMEILLQKKAGLYSGWISYSLSQVENRFPDLNGGIFFPALHDQRHEFKVVNLLNLKHWDFNATWIYASGRPYTEGIGTHATALSDGSEGYFIQVGQRNSLRLPAYHRLDLTATYKWRLGKVAGNAGAAVYNLYNRENIRTRRYRSYAPNSRTSSGRLLVANVTHLGITPNLFLSFDF